VAAASWDNDGIGRQPVLVIAAVRPGDSSGVLDAAGRLVGVVWGERDGMTYATCGRPVREFLDRVLGNRIAKKIPSAEVGSSVGVGDDPARGPQIDWQAWSNEIAARIAALDDKKQDKGDYLRPGDLNGYLSKKELPDPAILATRDEVTTVAQQSQQAVERVATESTSRLESLREHLHTRIEERVGQVLPIIETRISESKPGLLAGLSFGKLIVGALGLSGPLAAAVIMAAGLAGRRVKARVGKCANQSGSGTARLVQPIVVDSPPFRSAGAGDTTCHQKTHSKAHQWAMSK
jgi:hypothetical protein